MNTLSVQAEPGVPQVVMTREFDAPRDLVFRAFTEPDLLVQWLGPRKYVMEIDRYEVRDGGRWRYVHREPDGGAEHWFHGVFHGEPTPDRMVQTFEFEGWPGPVQMDTATFEERGGRTLVRLNSVFQSVENRDAMVASGMAEGVREGMDRLEELLAKLQANA
ncbi:MAG TPA: SRPBCC family protein [Actinomycetota bacterium]